MDPHGAIGYLALKKYLDQHPGNTGYFVETAHPVKFHDVMEPIIGSELTIPAPVQEQMKGRKNAKQMAADAKVLKSFLLSGLFN